MATPGMRPGKADGLAELKARLAFVLFAILVYRIGTHIPVPGINPDQLQALFNQ
ncbi:MAG: preprotein translocase subunit SecY, partial [Pseudohongiellaceae bacterium]